MFINNFIYFYIAICIILIVFELAWNIYMKQYDVRMAKMKIKYKANIYTGANCINKINVGRLSKELKNVNNLIAFQNAYEEILEENIRKDFIYEVLPVFIYLNIYYANRKNEMEKALFAYVVGKDLIINNIQNANILVETMYGFLNSNSLYCRANAMKALFSIEKVDNVIKAIGIINSNKLEYNHNLLTSNLKNFNGDKKSLATELNKSFFMYSENIQIAIIRFLTVYNFIEENELINRLKNPNLSVNVKCEIMRFFQENKNEDAKHLLISLLNNENIVANDFTLKAIGTVGYYYDNDVEKLLIKLKNSRDEMILEAVYRSIEKMETLKPA